MKFGKKLLEHADPTHLNHCIAYDVLTKAIKVVVAAYRPKQENEPDLCEDMEAVDQAFGRSTQTLSQPGAQPPDSRFHTLLQHELEKVNRFAFLQLRTLLDTLNEAQRELAHLTLDSADARSEAAALAAEKLLDTAGVELVALERFRRLNFTGFRKIAKKFDKKTREVDARHGSLASWFVPQLLRERFIATPLDPHLLAISWGYAALRRRRRSRKETELPTEGLAPAPSTSTTYWLTPSARMQALCMLVKRFDIVLEPSMPATDDYASLVEQQHRLLLSMSPDGAARVPFKKLSMDVSMLYYDAPGFPEYLARIKKEGLAGFHFRRTSLRSGTGGAASGGLVERDGAASALDAHALTELEGWQAVDAFPMAAAATGEAADAPGSKALLEAAEAALKGPGGTDPAGLAAFAREVKDAASSAPLAPVAAVGISRVLLRGDNSGTRGICVAIDEDVQISRGPAGPASIAPSDAIDFPYCLLEVAGAAPDNTSTWLAELRGHAILRKVAGFSIGAHAVATLHKEEVPELPHWYQQLSLAESSQPPEAWGLMLEWRAAVHETAEKDQGGGVSTAAHADRVAPVPLPAPPLAAASSGKAAAAALEDRELRPKDFLASERTMLEWMHSTVALAFLGFGLWRYSIHHSTPESRAATLGFLDTSDGTNLALGCYGLAMLGIAVLFGWCSVFAHLRRLKALVHNDLSEHIFNSRCGPSLFGLLVGLALVMNLGLQGTKIWAKLSSK